MSIFKMAWRNVWRNTRRTNVTIAAMTLALAVEVLYSGLVIGYFQAMERDILDLEVGDIQVFHPEFLETPSIYSTIADPAPIIDELDALGFPVAPRLLAGALAASGDSSAGVQIRGLAIDRERRVTMLHQAVGEGSWLDPADPSGVVIGRRLAKSLSVLPGGELILLGQAMDGSIANDRFTVRGVLKGIADGTDRTAVLLTEEAFRSFVEMPESIHQLVIRRPENLALPEAARAVREAAGGMDVKTWKELMPIVANMLDSGRGMIVIIFLVIYAAIAILVLNAMLMAVFERVREFGILKAIGVSPGSVFALIVVEAGIQTAAALCLGLLLSVPGMWYLSGNGINVGALGGTNVMGLAMRPVWYGIYTLDTIIVPIILLVVIVLLAVTYPALKAALIRPIRAIQHQ